MKRASAKRFTAAGLLSYVGLLVAGITIVLSVLQLGHEWGIVDVTSNVSVAKSTATSSVDVVLHVLGTLATVILLGAILGRICKYVGQPPVIGEVIAGLALGPSLLGMICPQAMHLLIPPQVIDPKGSVATSLKVIAQLGVILYMFLVGLELNAAKLKHKAHTAVAISHAVTVLLLPAFFAYTGMRTEIGLLNDLSQWFVCLVIILVATLGKFGGTLLAARYSGECWRDAGILGMLMNTRGLMELIVLNIGLDLGVIGPTLFAMMVIMALVTTMITSPALQFLGPASAPD